jgi:hypothetical protein
MHQTSTRSDKYSSPGEHLKDIKCALLSRCALLHANAAEQKRIAVAPWMNSPSKPQAPRVSLKLSRVLAQTPMKCKTLSSSRWCALLLFLTSLK